MVVTRIVANVASGEIGATADFYRALFGLELAMDHGWIATLAAPAVAARPQLSIAAEGGGGTPVPALSIEVDALEPVLAAARARSVEPVYGPVDEPWGVRRFFVRDPAGTLINVLTHQGDGR